MMDKTLQWVVSKIIEVAHPSFFGSITISFQAGKPQQVEVKRTEKPPAAGEAQC